MRLPIRNPQISILLSTTEKLYLQCNCQGWNSSFPHNQHPLEVTKTIYNYKNKNPTKKKLGGKWLNLNVRHPDKMEISIIQLDGRFACRLTLCIVEHVQNCITRIISRGKYWRFSCSYAPLRSFQLTAYTHNQPTDRPTESCSIPSFMAYNSRRYCCYAREWEENCTAKHWHKSGVLVRRQKTWK